MDEVSFWDFNLFFIGFNIGLLITLFAVIVVHENWRRTANKIFEIWQEDRKEKETRIKELESKLGE